MQTQQLLPAQSVLDTLDEWTRIVFENEQSFVDEFAPGWACGVRNIHFNSENVKATYQTKDDPHVVDLIPMPEFLEWAGINDKSSDGATPSCADIRALMARIFVARNITLEDEELKDCLDEIDSWYGNKEGGN